jgi:hypothetical protein
MYCFGARSTERFIQEPGQCAVIKQRLFRSESAARAYFRGEGSEFEIVRVTIETIDDAASSEETKVCQHDLLAPNPTVEVLSDFDARCSVCGLKWRIATAQNR